MDKLEHLKRWRESGKSRRGYCLENGINPNTFQSWLRKERVGVVEWQELQIKDTIEDSKNFFEFRIFDNWKFEIKLRIGNDIS